VETGTILSQLLISKWFKLRFQFKGFLRKTSIVPVDKYHPINIQRYSDYLAIVAQIDTRRLKFADEKCLKGAEIFN
jgi:hypothetical protein